MIRAFRATYVACLTHFIIKNDVRGYRRVPRMGTAIVGFIGAVGNVLHGRDACNHVMGAARVHGCGVNVYSAFERM